MPLDHIGTLKLQESPSVFDITTNAISAPDCQVVLADDEDCAKQPLMRYLCRAADCTEEDAYHFYQQFLQEIASGLEQNKTYTWVGLGTFIDEGGIKFEAEDSSYLKAEPVTINRLSVLNSAQVKPQEPDREDVQAAVEQQTSIVGDIEPVASPYRWLIGAAILSVLGAFFVAMRWLHIW